MTRLDKHDPQTGCPVGQELGHTCSLGNTEGTHSGLPSLSTTHLVRTIECTDHIYPLWTRTKTVVFSRSSCLPDNHIRSSHKGLEKSQCLCTFYTNVVDPFTCFVTGRDPEDTGSGTRRGTPNSRGRVVR